MNTEDIIVVTGLVVAMVALTVVILSDNEVEAWIETQAKRWF